LGDRIDILSNTVETVQAKLNGTTVSLPEASISDVGKVLRVDANGFWELAKLETIGDIT